MRPPGRKNAPKTNAGRRTVSDDETVGGVLLEWRLRQRAEADTLGSEWQDTGYVFTYEDGRPLLPQYVSRTFDKLREQARLPPMTSHELRHQSASLLLANAADTALVSKMLGHASVAITSDLYTHLKGRADREASAKAAASIPRGAVAHRVHTGQV